MTPYQTPADKIHELEQAIERESANEYRRGFAAALAYFTADELTDIARQMPPSAAYDSIREKVTRLQEDTTATILGA